MKPCLDDATMWELVEGRLAPDELPSVDEHLDSCEDCRALLLGLAAGGERIRAVDGEHAETAPLPVEGQALGRFVVLERIGSGAMGVVYAAHDPELDRRVAIKLLRPEHSVDAERARRRLLREAKAMARLSHANVVTVYEVGAWGEDVFVAMELVEGSSLRDWLAAEARPVSAIRAVLLDAGRGLLAAHEAGLVHRDFKPDNVVVGVDERAQVTDFGLAQAVDGQAPEAGLDEPSDLMMSHTRGVAGTPAYMAPELFEREEARPTSDQFAFCVTAYEALYGERPFAAITLAELEERLLRPPAPPPPGTDVPRALHEAIVRGLSVTPEARHGSMEALLEALDEGSAPGRRGGLRLAGAFALLAALLGAALWLRPAPPVEEVCAGAERRLSPLWGAERRAALEPSFAAASPELGPAVAASVATTLDRWKERWADAHASTCRATRVTGEQSEALLDLRMRCLDQRLVAANAIVDALVRGDARAVAAAPQLLAALPEVASCEDVSALRNELPRPDDASSRERLGDFDRELAAARASVVAGDLEAAASTLVRAFAVAEDLGFAPALAEAWLLRSGHARAQGQLVSARAHGYEALWAFEAARHDDGVARAWLALLAVAGEGGQIERAAELARHARAAAARLSDPARLGASVAHGAGAVATQLGDYERAEEQLELALSLRVADVGERHPEVARVLTSLGNLARLRGDREQALEHHRRALGIDSEAFGERHPANARHLHNIAGVLRGTGLAGDLTEALEHYTRALALRRAALGDGHPGVALTLNSLGLVHRELGDVDEARRHFERSRAAFSASGHLDEALPQQNIGLLELAAGNGERALLRFTSARRLFIESVGGDALAVGRVAADQGDALLALDRRPEADIRYREAQRIAEEAQDEELESRARAGLAAPVEEAAPPRPTRRRRARREPVGQEPARPEVEAPTPPPSMRSPNFGTYGASESWD